MMATNPYSSTFPVLLSQEKIFQRLDEIVVDIEKEYADKELVLIMVMKGAACITVDLMRRLTLPFELEYVQCKSYGMKGTTPGELTIIGVDHLDIAGKDVLIIEDICDKGQTLEHLTHALSKKNPATLKSFVMLLRETEKPRSHTPDYTMFSIAHDAFVIGYGLDYKEKYRGLPGVYLHE
jgi:hypoxanthine phosphoribosyltransferase